MISTLAKVLQLGSIKLTLLRFSGPALASALTADLQAPGLLRQEERQAMPVWLLGALQLLTDEVV